MQDCSRNVEESWRPVIGHEGRYEGRYEVSNSGRVRSLLTDKILKQGKNNPGYLVVGCSTKSRSGNKSVHRLVAESFIPDPLNLPQVNHIDGNKGNDIASNLEWCTSSCNRHFGTGIDRISSSNKTTRKGQGLKPVIKCPLSGEESGHFNSIGEATIPMGSKSPSSIGNVLHGRRLQAFGFKWKFKE